MFYIYYVLYTYKEGAIAGKKKQTKTHKIMTSIKYMCVYIRTRKYHYKRSNFDLFFL